MIIGGLDPGLAGALVCVRASPKWEVLKSMTWDARRASGNRRRAVQAIREGLQALAPAPAVVVTEAVGARPMQGLSSTFGFGLAVGVVEGILVERGATIVRVSPAKWKRHLHLNSDKRRSIALASCWWPDRKWLVKDHNIAEALLLAVWYAMQEAHRRLRPTEAGKWGIMQ